MNKNEFDQLRSLQDKSIIADITFSAKRDSGSDNLVFDQIQVQNKLGYDVFLNGTFKPSIPSLVFNFVVRGVGPICRVCVNGMDHKDVGRTHKHELIADNDPNSNLPTAIRRPDLDLQKQSVTEIWQTLCKEANIVHTGSFSEPEGNDQ